MTDEEGGDPREVFVEELCRRRQYFVVLFAFAVVFFLLQVPYIIVEEWGSTLHVLATLNVVGSGGFIVGCGSVMWLCYGD